MIEKPTPHRIGTWKFIYHNGVRLENIGRNADGTLRNPNGYPKDVVLAAIQNAEERVHERRSAAAKKAAETRRKRIEARVYLVAQRIVNGHVFGPAKTCQICGRGLDDPDSIERGIGSDCWQDVLELLEGVKVIEGAIAEREAEA